MFLSNDKCTDVACIFIVYILIDSQVIKIQIEFTLIFLKIIQYVFIKWL